MKYPNGYLPRIAYHIAETQNSDKILYFLNRQVEQYGELTQEQLEFVFIECVKKKHPTQALLDAFSLLERLIKES